MSKCVEPAMSAGVSRWTDIHSIVKGDLHGMHGEQYTKLISSLSERDLHCVYGMACTCAP